MIEYITVEEIDAKLGTEWASSDAKKAHAVMMTNVWLTNLRLPDVKKNDDLAKAVRLAGCEIVQEAAAGNLYQAKETGIASESVSAGSGVSVSSSYFSDHASYSAAENLAMSILKPWLNSGLGNVILLTRL